MPRRRYDEEHENHERWLISYADFITLLFAFFVVMYAISSINTGKYRVLTDALGSAFGSVQVTKPLNVVEQSPLIETLAQRKKIEAIKRERERMTRIAGELTSKLSALIKQGKVRVSQTGRGVTVEINASILFDPGQAVLIGDSPETLRTVAELLKDDSHKIEVEGHTDTTPIRNAQFPSNWELSATRAGTVVRLFVDAGVDEARLTAVGQAANKPVADNASPEGRARNRRVAVTLLSTLPDVDLPR
ncbi:flagellar motor protein MotD [Massilia sp. TS11]|uniref:flagellar motor protein MotD n=1 Tax=Massilia sp. TS11 TaxID=2908003 RepID=UPI001EDC55F9|nr:flagellar motor protein MotD [Massilia sp. TS11]MCG2582850.1 flagellar motor protein MotD [Massilia sp. TS11]